MSPVTVVDGTSLIASSSAANADFHGVALSAVQYSAPANVPAWQQRGYRAPARGVPGIC
ncbi:hypothetical protein [Sinomonas sp. P10A9]|uniref:Uncharacterized protein n=1 Tax=Sinomonas puerhi TaxID=3238584 RepID=A0AB39L415_9MICC